MRLLLALLLAASSALNAQTVTTTPVGVIGCDVVVNDKVVSSHPQQSEAHARAINEAFANPTLQVEFQCNNVFRVTATPAVVVPPVDPPPPVLDANETHTIEAEKPTSIVAPMVVVADANASGGSYIHVPLGTRSTPAGKAIYTFTVKNPGDYVLWGRVLAATISMDSALVSVDGGAPMTWSTATSSSWLWDQLNNWNPATNKYLSDPVVYTLSAGTHTITIQHREAGLKIDQLVLTRNLAFVPTVTPPVPPVVVPPPVGTPDTADLSWQASAGATGYRLYYGFAPRTYLQAKGAGIDLGNGTVTTYTATAAAAGKRHYFAITAYGQSGESAYSNEVFKDMP